ncbi:hypothetical protein FHR24_001460 [Wenyingzhuangia heitensis]|uniref:Transposase n=1 Tax=Wenyingzhuangia heitensis TaxID=1487859 RepID=A0ABX0UBT7_9FLAO|nr:hypothetical protein [Wenyingzhuangia heitensis]NIJ45021.1 hypothetical protein [Wenyingzhuangia heitensis]
MAKKIYDKEVIDELALDNKVNERTIRRYLSPANNSLEADIIKKKYNAIVSAKKSFVKAFIQTI